MSLIHPTAPARIKIKALVADDDPIMRSLVREQLERRHVDVIEAEDGGEAWQHLSNELFQLAIIDLGMPRIDGYSLIQCMRGHPKTRHLPIVVVTAHEDSESVSRAFAAGATSFLTKPVPWTMFGHHLDYILRLTREAHVARFAQHQTEAAGRVKDRLVGALGNDARLIATEIVRLVDQGHRLAAASGTRSGLPEVLERIAHQAASIVDVVEGLLPQWRTVTEHTIINEDKLPVTRIVQLAARALRAGADERNVQLVVAPPPARINVVCDEESVTRALSHIIANALEHAPPGSMVEVSTDLLDDDGLAISIADVGPGMSADELNRHLRPLDHAVDARDTLLGTAGLGLPLSKAIAEAHGGGLAIRSAPGAGTTVTFVLPSDRVEIITQ
ncbi:MAG: response regulator [Hyphomicrobiaceae bacterium]